MYPYKLFLGLDLYSILITVGVVACLLLLRLQGDWRELQAKHQNFLLTLVPLAVVLGYVAAVLIQGLYNMAALGEYRIDGATGATFFGGLLGGVIVFVSLYFGVGHFKFRDGYHKAHFRDVLDLAAACITVAHGFGRLGCLMAGCCHGPATDAWYGLEMVGLGYRVVPVQLFEALFLFCLTAVLLLLMKKGKRHQMPIYTFTYGAWRFLIEYVRADDRGETIVSFLSPSQLFALVLILGGAVLLAVEIYLDRRALGQGGAHA